MKTQETNSVILPAPPDFSLIRGGPWYHLWRRTGLAGDPHQFMRRRVLVLVLLTWVPLLVLSVAEGHAWGDSVKVPFLRDVETNARLLLALPLLILAEPFVDRRLSTVVGQFLSRGLVSELARAKFDAAIASAMRLRNSIVAEVLLVAVVYATVLLYWRTQVVFDVATWYSVPTDGQLRRSLAAWWVALVSLPLYGFLILRWGFRLFIWGRFLWQISRIDLKFIATHPDRSGGVGFLSSVARAFAPVALAQGVVLSGMIADRIFYTGAKLPEFKLELIGIGAVIVLAIFGPLLVFAPKLAVAKRTGMREYGGLAQRYVREFDDKWLRGGAPAEEPLMGSADIQSLADMGNSYDVVKEMKPVPFTTKHVLQLVVITLLPVAPLLLTMIPLEELLARLLKVIF